MENTNTIATKAAVQVARDEFKAAETRLNELVEERSRASTRIQSASIEAAREKAAAARNGGEIASQVEAEVSSLRERLNHIPYEIHAQELFVEESKLELYAREDEDRLARHVAAEEVFEEVKARYDIIEKEYKAAKAARVDPLHGSHATTLAQLARENIRRLEAAPPGEFEAAGAYSPRRSRDPRSRMTAI